MNGHHPAIVDRALYERVQNLLECGKTVRPTIRTFRALSGMLICAHCGRFLNAAGGNGNPTWVCPSTRLNNGIHICSAESISERRLDELLRKAVAERFGNGAKGNSTIEAYAATKKNFTAKMKARLEAIQANDSMEQERVYLGKAQSRIACMGNRPTPEEFIASVVKIARESRI